MGISEKLSPGRERLYYDLAFYAGAQRRPSSADEDWLSDLFEDLDASVDPLQQMYKWEWSVLGHVYGGVADEHTRTQHDFSGIVGEEAPTVGGLGQRHPDPDWTLRMARKQDEMIRRRIKPLLREHGLQWLLSHRTGPRNRYGLR